MSDETFHREVATKFLAGFIPELITRGGDEKDVLAIVEIMVAGSLWMCRETYGVDPHRAFEIMQRRVTERIEEQEHNDKKKKLILS